MFVGDIFLTYDVVSASVGIRTPPVMCMRIREYFTTFGVSTSYIVSNNPVLCIGFEPITGVTGDIIVTLLATPTPTW